MTSPTMRRYPFLCAALTLISIASLVNGQTSTPATAVPTMVKFSGTVQGMPSRIIGMTFALYKESQGGPALWLETQSVSLDASGRYSVQLVAAAPDRQPQHQGWGSRDGGADTKTRQGKRSPTAKSSSEANDGNRKQISGGQVSECAIASHLTKGSSGAPLSQFAFRFRISR